MGERASGVKRSGVVALVALGALALGAPGCRRPAWLGGAGALGEDCRAAIRQVSEQATEPIQVTAYVTRTTPELTAYVARLEADLGEAAAASANRVVVHVVDAAAGEAKKKAMEAGCLTQAFPAPSGGDAVSGFMCVVVEYRSRRDAIKALDVKRSGVGALLASKLREVREQGDRVRHKIGLLSGLGEINLNEPNLAPIGAGNRPTMLGAASQYFPNVEFVGVFLRDVTPIDESLEGLIVTQPGRDLTERELRLVDQFVMKGKALVVFAGAANLRAGDGAMRATLSTHGLERLLSGYGIDVARDVLLEQERPFNLEVATSQGPQKMRFPFVVSLEAKEGDPAHERMLEPSFPVLASVESLMVPFASSLELHPEKQPSARVRPVMFAPSASRETGPTVDLKPLQTWKAPAHVERRTLGAVAEGKLRSAFAGDDLGVRAPAAAATDRARVFVVASSQFLANPFARAGNATEGSKSGMSLVGSPEAMPGDEQLAPIARTYGGSVMGGTLRVLGSTLAWMTAEAALARCAEPRTP